LTLFQKIFEKLDTLLSNKTIDKFSEKFFKRTEAGRAAPTSSIIPIVKVPF
jgi:hypothetical protein